LDARLCGRAAIRLCRDCRTSGDFVKLPSPLLTLFKFARCSVASRSGSSAALVLCALVLCLLAIPVRGLLDIPVRPEDCVASVYAVGDSSQPGTKTASGISLNDNAMTAAFWHQPPRLKSSRSRRFSPPIRFRSPFRAKRTGNCVGLRRMGWPQGRPAWEVATG